MAFYRNIFVLSTLFIIVMSCSNTRGPKSPSSAAMGFDFQGHRGCRGLMPENTIPAFLKALQLGATTLEMDAVITKDKQVILSHEPFFNHEITTKPNDGFIEEKEEKGFNIYQMDFAETQRYDVGLKPHPRFAQQQKLPAHKPLLGEVVDSAEAYAKAHSLPPVYYNIETKSQPSTDDIYHPQPAAFVDLVMGVVLLKKIEQRTIIQSFDIRTLQYLHTKYPTIKTALLIENFDAKTFAQQLKDLGFIPTIYSPEHTLVTKLLVQQCRGRGIKLIPWTVNDVATMKALKTLGVDGLISDYPNLYGNLR